MQNLTEFTIADICYIITHQPSSSLRDFKRNLVIELRENYKLSFPEIGELLNENFKGLKTTYYKNER